MVDAWNLRRCHDVQYSGTTVRAGTAGVLMAFSNPADSIVLPAGATTGTPRFEIGGSTPPELVAFGIDVAIRSYVVNKNTLLEVGYFWIGLSNRFDGFGDNIVQAYGNVVYPVPGNPLSPTASNVYTNFQQNLHSPYPQTIFKDQDIQFWVNLQLETANGFNKLFVGDAGGTEVVTLNASGIALNGVALTYNTTHAKLLLESYFASMSGPALPVNGVATLLPGTLINATAIAAGMEFEAQLVCDFQHSTAGAGDVVVGELIVDGASTPGQVIFNGNASTQGLRTTITQQYGPIVLAASGAHTFQARVQKAGGTDGHVTVNASHTTLKVQLYKRT